MWSFTTGNISNSNCITKLRNKKAKNLIIVDDFSLEIRNMYAFVRNIRISISLNETHFWIVLNFTGQKQAFTLVFSMQRRLL